MREILRKIARRLLADVLAEQERTIQAREEAIQTLAHALVYITTPPDRPGVSRIVRMGRMSYAEEQMSYEWSHNKRAQEIVQRAKLGIF